MIKRVFSQTTLMCLIFSINSEVKAESEKPSQILDDIVVTADNISHTHNGSINPTHSLSGDALVKKAQTSLGSTLSQEAGIHSADYGSNVSRPVMRGLSGDQIIILQNGINHLDASSISADHNSAINPLSLEQIDIIRGPASLIYGAKSVGGLVNLIDNRIPKDKIHETITGMIDARGNSATQERSGSFMLEGGVGDFSWHINGGQRKTSDMKIPSFARSDNLRQRDPLEADETEEYHTVNNSQSETQNITAGISKQLNNGYFGIAYSDFRNNYGILGHEHHHEEEHDDEEIHEEEESDPTLEMHQKRFDMAGQYHKNFSFIDSIEYKIGYTDYEHQEIEGDEVGTAFDNRGYDGRFEFTHQPTGFSKGLLGLQMSRNNFSVTGEEAFLPETTTNNISAFFLETFPIKKHEIQFSGRLENQVIDKEKSINFGNDVSKKNVTFSTSLGGLYHLNKDYDIAVSGSYNQRPPNAQELYSNGEHFATSSFEIGNQNLKVQKSFGGDIAFRKLGDNFTGEVNFFYNHFQDYIALNPTGETNQEEELPVFVYENIPAEFYGTEIKTSYLVYEKDQKNLKLRLQGDYVKARNRKTDVYLPRIPPLRLGFSVDYNHDDYGVQLDTTQIFAQNNTANNELATDGYTMLNVGLDYDLNIEPTSSVIYLQATNLLNQDARNHVSFLKDKVPLTGRSLMMGIRTAF